MLWFGSFVSLSICLITLSQLHVNLLCDYGKPICQPCWERLDWLKRWFCFLFKTDENDLKIFLNVIPWPEKSQGPEEGIGLLTANKISFWKKIPRETCEKFCEIILKNTSLLESDLCFSPNKRVGTKVWLVSTKFPFFSPWIQQQPAQKKQCNRHISQFSIFRSFEENGFTLTN